MYIGYQKNPHEIISWIKQIVRTAGFYRVVIGLSGGIDSALCATLAVKALGKENVYTVMLPYGKLSNIHVKDAKEVADWLGIPEENRVIIDIKRTVDVIANQSELVKQSRQFKENPTGLLRYYVPRNDVLKGNIMARVRMIYLFDLAKKFDALVCGTENKTEHYLGYFTRFGDAASDLEPIQSLYKSQVRSMAKFMDIPEKIITKAPTAGLWARQTDEKEFGFTYEQADQVLYYHFDKKLSAEEIVGKRIDPRVIEKVLRRVKQNEFKLKLP